MKIEGRVMSIDFGLRNIGVCVSDKLNLIPTPIDNFSFEDDNIDKKIELINDLINKLENISRVIIGFPGNDFKSNDSEVKKEIHKLHEALSKNHQDKKIILFDESNSTKKGREMLFKNKSVNEYKKIRDVLAAYVILKDYLDSINL